MEEAKEKLHVLHRHGLAGFATAYVAWLALAEIKELTFGQPAPASDNEDGVDVLDLSNKNCIEAWLEMFPEVPIPDILHYVADRGTWALEHSKEINAFISTMPQDFSAWLDFYTPGAYDGGKAILAFLELEAEEQAIYKAGLIIGAFSLQKLTNDAVWMRHENGEGARFSVGQIENVLGAFWVANF